eukprot:994282-Amphidinium_carterae.2
MSQACKQGCWYIPAYIKRFQTTPKQWSLVKVREPAVHVLTGWHTSNLRRELSKVAEAILQVKFLKQATSRQAQHKPFWKAICRASCSCGAGIIQLKASPVSCGGLGRRNQTSPDRCRPTRSDDFVPEPLGFPVHL